MASSCLNRTLISNAVAGTGANVSLLMEALAPLCAKQHSKIKVFAESSYFVITCYVVGFLPWGLLVLFDFISPKWKTVRATRRDGKKLLIGFLGPMLFVGGYAVVQLLAGDFQEMMTAAIAMVLTFYHTARTVWGLAQLRVYLRWCEKTLQCVRASRPKSVKELFGRERDSIRYDETNELHELDTILLVNSEIVDNEFVCRDVTMWFSFRDWRLKISNPAVCTVRWVAAFVCSLGDKWKSGNNTLLPRRLEKLLLGSTLLFGDSSSTNCSTSLSQLALTCLNVNPNCGILNAVINEKLLSGKKPFNSYKFEFDNTVSTYPTQTMPSQSESRTDNRLCACVEMVEYVLTSRILGEEQLRSISSHSEQLRDKFLCYRQFDDAFQLLLNQIGIHEDVSYEDIHWLWKLVLMPQWSVKPNAYLLQTSVYCDNEASTNQERMFSRRNRFPPYILGASLDSVRTLLAKWTLLFERKSQRKSCWKPTVPSDAITFVSKNSNLWHSETADSWIISKCQHVVHREISKLTVASRGLPSSTAMISLLLLSYSSLHIVKTTQEIVIRPLESPQDITLSIAKLTRSGKQVLKLRPGTNVKNFMWVDWINAALRKVKSHNELVRTHRVSAAHLSGFVESAELIKSVNLTGPMQTWEQATVNQELRSLPGPVTVWTGWPIFDARFCQYELDQWMEAANHDGALLNDKEYEKQKRNAMEVFPEIARMNMTP